MTNSITPPDRQSQLLRDYAGRLVVNTSKFHSNLGQDIVLTTEDKIRLSLIRHLSKLEKRKSWITPLGILLTILIVFPTTTFKSFLLISAETWQAIFILSGFLSLVWLIFTVRSAFIAVSIDSVIEEIKKSGYLQSDIAIGIAAASSNIQEISLEFENGKTLFNPDDEQIAKALRESFSNENNFAIMSKEPLSYIQTARSNTGFILEFHEALTDTHYQCANFQIALDAITQVFQQYAKDQNGWKSGFEWNKLDLRQKDA